MLFRGFYGFLGRLLGDFLDRLLNRFLGDFLFSLRLSRFLLRDRCLCRSFRLLCRRSLDCRFNFLCRSRFFGGRSRSGFGSRLLRRSRLRRGRTYRFCGSLLCRNILFLGRLLCRSSLRRRFCRSNLFRRSRLGSGLLCRSGLCSSSFFRRSRLSSSLLGRSRLNSRFRLFRRFLRSWLCRLFFRSTRLCRRLRCRFFGTHIYFFSTILMFKIGSFMSMRQTTSCPSITLPNTV